MVTVEQVVNKEAVIGVVGLGYVGLPLAAAFGRQARVVGFDIHAGKIDELKNSFDATGELSAEELTSTQIDYTTDPASLKKTDFLIVTVPTPIDENNNPDLTPMEKASITIGQNLKKGVSSFTNRRFILE